MAGRAAALVRCLLLPSGPPAIRRPIVPVIVDPVQCVSTRPRAHVCEECGEALAPSLTYSDAAAAVVLEGVMVGVVATRFHGQPALMCRRAGPAMGRSVAPFPTTATNDAPTAQPRGRRGCRVTAVAAALPLTGALTVRRNRLQGHQAAKSLAADVVCGLTHPTPASGDVTGGQVPCFNNRGAAAGASTPPSPRATWPSARRLHNRQQAELATNQIQGLHGRIVALEVCHQ